MSRAPKKISRTSWLVSLALASAIALWVLASVRQAKPGNDASASPNDGTNFKADETRAASVAKATIPQNYPDTEKAELRQRLANGASLDEIRETLKRLARTQPALAMELALEVARSDLEKYQLTAAVVGLWAQDDPAAAWAWALPQSKRLTQPGETPLLAIVLDEVATVDPTQVVTLADSALRQDGGTTDSNLDPGELTQMAVQALLQSGHADLAQAAVEAWAGGAYPKIGNAAFEEVALNLAKNSPQAASDWLRSLPVSDGRNQALATLAAEWAGTAPQAALDWAAKLDANDGRTDAMQRAFDRWAATDLVSAAHWLGENESNPAADGMIAHMIGESALGETDPQLALKWADLISDDDLKSRSVEQVVIAWGERDPAAATRYLLETTALKPEQKNQLEESLRARANAIPGTDK